MEGEQIVVLEGLALVLHTVPLEHLPAHLAEGLAGGSGEDILGDHAHLQHQRGDAQDKIGVAEDGAGFLAGPDVLVENQVQQLAPLLLDGVGNLLAG
ncbi:hypothetical protein SDC9_211999 [bioreactor metagenome]|uniref:Uncharacterized protein n=1 Tax=bioreactor metagenome TaxID=1076179 RepID=A0A645JKM6_9ZZZZ